MPKFFPNLDENFDFFFPAYDVCLHVTASWCIYNYPMDNDNLMNIQVFAESEIEKEDDEHPFQVFAESEIEKEDDNLSPGLRRERT